MRYRLANSGTQFWQHRMSFERWESLTWWLPEISLKTTPGQGYMVTLVVPIWSLCDAVWEWWVFAKETYRRHGPPWPVMLFLTWVSEQELLVISTAATRQMTVARFTDVKVPLDHQEFPQIRWLRNICIYLMQIRDLTFFPPLISRI